MSTNCPATCASLGPVGSSDAVTTVTASTASLEDRVVVVEYGVDYYQPQAPFESAADLETCIGLCQARSGCTHFSFAWGMCWFKTSSEGHTLNEYLISGNVIGAPAGAAERENARNPAHNIDVSDLLQHRLLTPRDSSAQTCSELGWQPGTNSQVCGNSKPFGTCHKTNIDYRSAMATCNAAGARLCHASELQSNSVKSVGCNLDNKMVWTGDSCGDDMFLVAKGSKNDNNPPQCKHISEQSSLRCCADEHTAPSSQTGPSILPPKPKFSKLKRAQLKELTRAEKKDYRRAKRAHKKSLAIWKQLQDEIKAANVVGVASQASRALISAERPPSATTRSSDPTTVSMVIAPVVVGVLCALAVLGVRLRRTARTSTTNSQPIPDVVSASDMLLNPHGNSQMSLV
jgi:hypothetical protein